MASIDDHSEVYGVEPICRVLPIAPSTYRERAAQRREPSRMSPLTQRDQALKPEVLCVFSRRWPWSLSTCCLGQNLLASPFPS